MIADLTVLPCRPALAIVGLSVLLTTASGCASSTFRERDQAARGLTSLQQHWTATSIEDAMAPISNSVTVRGGEAPAAGGNDSAGSDSAEKGTLDRAGLRKELVWQLALHRTIEPSQIRYGEHGISATVTLNHDLSRLLDHPGWEWEIEYTFDAAGRIRTMSATPQGPPAPLGNWLSPAIPWLRQHRPADLEWLYPEGRWNRSPRAAHRWSEVLVEWRAATGRRPLATPGSPSALQRTSAPTGSSSPN